jgi:hypothetical protein
MESMPRQRSRAGAFGVMFVVSALVMAAVVARPAAGPVVPEPGSPAAAGLARDVTNQSTALRPAVLELALQAVACASRGFDVGRPTLLTIIDYSVPSTDARLWVVDLVSRRVLFQEAVAHGRNSGDNFARWFSNRAGSYQSSLGLFLTGDTYVGRNGYSLRLHGLEPGVNDRALDRAIVMHGADYADPAQARAVGRLGRSQGCPAVRPAVARPLIDTIKGGSFLFAYYPDDAWLSRSPYLACGGTT